MLRKEADIVAPMIFAGPMFYDTFVFRKNGQRFKAEAPYHPHLHPYELTTVDSVGSAFIMTPDVARSVRMTTGVLVEFCNNARALGHRVAVDPTLRIEHPWPSAPWRKK